METLKKRQQPAMAMPTVTAYLENDTSHTSLTEGSGAEPMVHHDHAGEDALLHLNVETRPRFLRLPDDFPATLPSLEDCIAVFTHATSMH